MITNENDKNELRDDSFYPHETNVNPGSFDTGGGKEDDDDDKDEDDDGDDDGDGYTILPSNDSGITADDNEATGELHQREGD